MNNAKKDLPLGRPFFFCFKKSSAGNPFAIRMLKKVDNRSLSLRLKFFGGSLILVGNQ
jgi:hypothetical protein